MNPRFIPRSPASLLVVVNVQQELYTCSRGLSSLLFSSDFKFRDMHTQVSLICKIFLRKECVCDLKGGGGEDCFVFTLQPIHIL